MSEKSCFKTSDKWESWIWTELLAFDNSLPDFGVNEWLEHSGHHPFGISLLLMSPDFLLRHSWSENALIPADAASRQGHLSNGIRERQNWTQGQLKALVKELQRHQIKVIFSIFCNDLGDTFHREFINEFCYEPGFNPLTLLRDGRDAGALFTGQLEQVIRDYGFDGWHGADTIACPWNIDHICFGGDTLFSRFAEQYGCNDIPDDLRNAGEDRTIQRKRLDRLCRFRMEQWSDFLLAGWRDFWQACTDTVHRLNGLVVVNSPNTKSIFGALQYMALDYRELDKMGIDRLVVETNTTSAALLWHQRDYLHEFSAVLAEMTAAMPNTGIIMMPCMQDTVECYDALRHAPGMFERDFEVLAAQQIIRGGKAGRCADGVMICLGDALTRDHWSMVNRLLNRTAGFEAERSGELVWLLDKNCFDALREDHRRYGTWSPAYQAGKLKEYSSLDISSIASPEELPYLDMPLFVPDFHLLSKELQKKLLSSSLPLVLTGNLNDMCLPDTAGGACWRVSEQYTFGCVLLNWKNSAAAVEELVLTETHAFDHAAHFGNYRECYPRLGVPEKFWEHAAALIRQALGEVQLREADRSVQQLRQLDRCGNERFIICSREWYYQTFTLEPGTGKRVIDAESDFPVFPVVCRDGKTVSNDPIPLAPHVPPQGCCVFRIKNFENKSIDNNSVSIKTP